MTTILMRETNKGVEIAYDSLCTGSDSFELEQEKVFKHESGIIFGAAGPLLMNFELKHMHIPSLPRDPALTEKWVVKVLMPHVRKLMEEVMPRRNGDYVPMGILAVVNGKVYDIGGDLAVCRRSDGIYTIGSGSGLAFGAIKTGADLARALEIAASADPYTGGRLTVTTAKELLKDNVS